MKCELTILTLLITLGMNAQTTEEWVEQKKTQKKYLIAQIQALNVYEDYLKKGFEISGKGLDLIHSIKNGDFNLHSYFFNSLEKLNPSIANWGRLEDIMMLHAQIVRQVNETAKAIRPSDRLSREEVTYCINVFKRVGNECLGDLDELALIMSTGHLAISDNERIRRIEKIYQSIKDKRDFVFSFCGEALILIQQREQD